MFKLAAQRTTWRLALLLFFALLLLLPLTTGVTAKIYWALTGDSGSAGAAVGIGSAILAGLFYLNVICATQLGIGLIALGVGCA